MSHALIFGSSQLHCHPFLSPLLLDCLLSFFIIVSCSCCLLATSYHRNLVIRLNRCSPFFCFPRCFFFGTYLCFVLLLSPLLSHCFSSLLLIIAFSFFFSLPLLPSSPSCAVPTYTRISIMDPCRARRPRTHTHTPIAPYWSGPRSCHSKSLRAMRNRERELCAVRPSLRGTDGDARTARDHNETMRAPGGGW